MAASASNQFTTDEVLRPRRHVNFSIDPEPEVQEVAVVPAKRRKLTYNLTSAYGLDLPQNFRGQRVYVETDTKVTFLMRSASVPNLTKQNFSAFRKLEEMDARNFKSGEDLRREAGKWGCLSSEERDEVFHKMSRVYIYLGKYNYNFETTSVMDIMNTCDAVYKLFTFICSDPRLSKKLPVDVPPCMGGSRPERRAVLINFMLKISDYLTLVKRIRKSDLVNPVARDSKRRVIDFFFQLVRYLEDYDANREKGVTVRRRRKV